MPRFFLFLVFVFTLASAQAQGFKKYPINNSGCSVYLYCDPGKFDESYSNDSSRIYTAECDNGEVTYGILCVKLLSVPDDLDMAENLVINYLDYLKTAFNIQSAAGYGKGHRLANRENTRGVIDYWQDKDKLNWKIEGWTDGNFIGVLYAKSKKDLPETKIDTFLNGFRMPEL